MAHSFTHFSIEERETIQDKLRDGWSYRKIGEHLGRSHTSVSREVKKNYPQERNVYTPRLAHERAQETCRTRGRRPRLKQQLIRDYVLEKLPLRWSPEQIKGRLLEEHGYHISHEAIYQFIYSQYYRGGNGRCVGYDLVQHLRRKHKRRARKYVPHSDIPLHIQGKVSIEERPRVVLGRTELGHWETDSIVSRGSSVCLNTTVERVSGLVKISRLSKRTSDETRNALEAWQQAIPEHLKKSITSDNGTEFALHRDIGLWFTYGYFFCHPYASWERGTNENANGLIRDYYPKKTDFATVSYEDIQRVEDALNNRPRKRLNYKTPLEVWSGAITRGM